jgi:multisubunit Na+/H+ antiporter MnhG subunit
MYPLIFGLTVTSLSLVGLHWMPYPKRLHAIGNYTLGTLAIFVGLTIWRPDLWLMWAFPIVGGATVSACYLLDHLLNLRIKAALHESEHERVSESARD